MALLSAELPSPCAAHRRRALRSRAGLLALALAALALAPFGSSAAPTGRAIRESDLKAAFLFHFAHFVTWPEDAFGAPDAPFTIGILGDNPFGRTLDELVAGEHVGTHPLEVRTFTHVDSLVPVHILFVSDPGRATLRSLAGALRDRPTLTVGDARDFARRGGMIGFVTAQRRVRVQINQAAAERARLQISSLLLRQAQIVETAQEWQ